MARTASGSRRRGGRRRAARRRRALTAAPRARTGGRNRRMRVISQHLPSLTTSYPRAAPVTSARAVRPATPGALRTILTTTRCGRVGRASERKSRTAPSRPQKGQASWSVGATGPRSGRQARRSRGRRACPRRRATADPPLLVPGDVGDPLRPERVRAVAAALQPHQTSLGAEHRRPRGGAPRKRPATASADRLRTGTRCGAAKQVCSSAARRLPIRLERRVVPGAPPKPSLHPGGTRRVEGTHPRRSAGRADRRAGRNGRDRDRCTGRRAPPPPDVRRPSRCCTTTRSARCRCRPAPTT